MTIDEIIEKIKQLSKLNDEIWSGLVEVCNDENYKNKLFSNEHFYRSQGFDAYLNCINNEALHVKEHYVD